MPRYRVTIELTFTSTNPLGSPCHPDRVQSNFAFKVPQASDVTASAEVVPGFLNIGTKCRYTIDFSSPQTLALGDIEEWGMQAVNEAYDIIDRAASFFTYYHAEMLDTGGALDLFFPAMLTSVTSGFVVGALIVVALRMFGRR